MDSFWDFFWFIVSFFLLMAYLMVLFQIIGDLFRDKSVSGAMKAIWVFFLIFLPILTSLVYLTVRGQGSPVRRGELHPLGLGCRLAGRRDRPGQGPARRRFDLPAGVRVTEGQGAGVAPW
jgi:hypothetical protein